MRVLLLLFQFGFLLFIYFLLWLLWPNLPKLCWIIVVRVGTLVLFLTLGEMLQFFTIEDNVCCGFVIYSFYYVEVCSFYSCFLESFYHKWMLNFVKGFLCIYEIIIWFLLFNLLMWCITLIDLRILKNLWIPGIKPIWSWCMMCLIYCWILFARILLRIFASMFICDIGLWFSFFVASLSGFVLGWWWTHRVSLEVFLPLQVSGRVWVG